MKPFTIHPQRKKSINRSHVLRFEALEDRCVLDVSLVADINLTGAGGDPTQFTAVGDTAFFAGTFEVQNYGRDGDHSNYHPRNLTSVGGKLFFSAGDLRHGNELYVATESDSAFTRAPEQISNLPTQPTRGAPVRRTSYSATGSVTNNMNDVLGDTFASKPPINAITIPRSESDRLPVPTTAIDAVFSGLPFDLLFERRGVLDSRAI